MPFYGDNDVDLEFIKEGGVSKQSLKCKVLRLKLMHPIYFYKSIRYIKCGVHIHTINTIAVIAHALKRHYPNAIQYPYEAGYDDKNSMNLNI